MQSAIISYPNTELKKISLYPNPGNKEIRIDFNLSDTQEIKTTIVSLLGDRVNISEPSLYLEGEHSLIIDIKDLQNGEYNFIFHYGYNYEILKFVVSR